MKPVIAVVGAGAIGCYYGARLAQDGHAVHFLARSGYSVMRSRGLAIQSPDGDFSLRPNQFFVYETPNAMPKADLVLVTLKTTANDFFQPLIAPLLHDRTMILTLQNGLGNEDRLAELFGPSRILGGLAFVCVNRLEDGTIRHLDHGLIKIGEFAGPPRERTHQIARMFANAKVRCEVLHDLMYGRWEKLVWNVPFNGLGAVLDKTTDKLIATANGRQVVTSLMLEIIAVAAALSIRLPDDLPRIKIEHTVTMGPYKTSMQIDKQQHRAMEIEAILGKPLRTAKAAGIATPYLTMLYDLATLP
jgi:2-dehydropantoate 2-reductase